MRIHAKKIVWYFAAISEIAFFPVLGFAADAVTPISSNAFSYIGLAIFILVVVLALLLVSNVISLIVRTPRLREKETEMTAIIEHLSDGLIEHDEQNTILLMNSAAEELLGVKSKNIIGKQIRGDTAPHDPSGNVSKIFRLKYVKPQDLPRTAYGSSPVSGTSKIRQRICEMKIHEPQERYVLIFSIDYTSTQEKKERRYIKIIRDVTRERILSRIKSEFITIAAHQLRTPTSGIKWALELLLSDKSDNLTEEQKTLIKQSHETTEKVILLINELLNVSKIEEGRFDFSFKETEFLTQLKIIAESLKTKLRVKNHTLKTNFPENASRLYIDAEKLSLAINNILDNAVYYTPPGGMISISYEEKSPFACITITDTGVGIPKKELPRLFSKFFRTKTAISMNTDGSGLGLYIAKNILLAHRGDIAVESKENKGTKVVLKLPLKNLFLTEKDASFEEIVGAI